MVLRSSSALRVIVSVGGMSGDLTNIWRAAVRSLALAMILRSRYLLERVLETDPKRASKFRAPIKEMFIG